MAAVLCLESGQGKRMDREGVGREERRIFLKTSQNYFTLHHF